jgi:hypothetical protein
MLNSIFHKVSFKELKTNLSDGVYLWLWQVDQTPPHIGISENGSYFGLKMNKKEVGIDSLMVLNKIVRRNIPMLFLKIESIPKFLNLHIAFEEYISCEIDLCSCLRPISEAFKLNNSQAVLFDLVEQIEENGGEINQFGFQLPKDFSGIGTYDYQMVEDHIFNLSKR